MHKTAMTSPNPDRTGGLTNTSWTMIDMAVSGEGEQADAAKERFVRRYWPAVYAYFRKSGQSCNDASDLSQGFFCDVVFGRNLLSSASPQRGRFRSLLLTAAQNYVRERYRYDRRAKRWAGTAPLTLSESEAAVKMSQSAQTPEAAFTQAWAMSQIDDVLQRTQQSCREDGLDLHWAIFETRVVKPAFDGERVPSYSALVERYDLSGPGQAANMMVVVKRRFARLLWEAIGETVSDPMMAKLELEELLKILGDRS